MCSATSSSTVTASFSKEELLDNVWGDRFVSESALTTRIKMARRAIGDDGRTQRLIRNSHGRGYQFVGEVTEMSADPGPEPPDGPSTADDTGSSPTPAADLDSSLLVDDEFGFVGRGELLVHAAARVQRVVAGGSGAILIGGEPGIGKTRLAAEIARLAHNLHAVRTLAGRCDRHLAASLQPWLEALGGYVQSAPLESLRSDSVGIVEHLRAVFPSLQVRLAAAGDNPMTAAADQYAVLDALVVLLERVSARSPLLIVLDDIQWAGGATRALASLLLRRGLARVLLVVTIRTTIDDLDDVTRDWLNEMSGYSTVDRFELGSLERSDLDELLQDLDLADNVRDQICELSGGHSLFAVKLLRDVRRGADLPGLPTRWQPDQEPACRLPDDVSQLVGAGAAIGPDFDLRIAGEAAGLSPLAALEAVETALEAELVHEVEGSGDRFRFSHQLVRPRCWKV